MPYRHRVVRPLGAAVSLMLAVANAANAQQALRADAPSATTRLSLRIEPRPADSWLFGRIQDVAVDGAGRVYVLDGTDQTIRVFSASGKPVRVIGKTGRGPGEFLQPRTMEIVNDTLWVIDNKGARLSAFSAQTGAYLRSTRSQAYSQSTAGVSTGGVFIVESESGADATSTTSATMRITHERAGTTQRRPIGSFTITRPPLSVRMYAGTTKNVFGQGSGRQPLDNGWLSRVAPSGRSIVLLDRSQSTTAPTQTALFGTAAPSSFRIAEIGWKGDTLQNRRYTVPSRAVSSADIASIVDSLANPNVIMGGSKLFGNSQDIRDSLYTPKLWPPVTEFLVGLDGCIWLRQPQPASKFAKFWRIAADGTEALPVMVPSTVRPLRVSLNRIWGVAEDADGAPMVQVLDVVAPVPSKASVPLRR